MHRTKYSWTAGDPSFCNMQSFGACGGCALFRGHESTCPAENNSGHHIIATSADHSLGLPMLLSLWCFGLFNNHVGPAHPLRPSQCCSPSSHSGYPPPLSRSRSIPVERSCCTTRVPRHVQRIQCACTSSPPFDACMKCAWSHSVFVQISITACAAFLF